MLNLYSRVDQNLKQELIDTLIEHKLAREILTNQRRAIDAQLTARNAAINAITAALGEFEIADRLTDALDPSASDGYNGGAVNSTEEKE